MSFVDAEGNDLAEGLKSTLPEDSFEANYVAPEQYILTSSPSYTELTDPYPILTFFSPRAREKWEEMYGKDPDSDDYKGRYILGIQMYSEYGNYWDKITYNLTCPHVFGDYEAHEIVTYWGKPPSDYYHFRACYRVVVDGREFTDITYEKNVSSYSSVTITLDR